MREPRDTLARALGEPDGFECRQCALPRIRDPAERQRELDILERREMRNEARLLTDICDGRAAMCGARLSIERRQLGAGRFDRSGIRQLETREQMQECCFPGARR